MVNRFMGRQTCQLSKWRSSCLIETKGPKEATRKKGLGNAPSSTDPLADMSSLTPPFCLLTSRSHHDKKKIRSFFTKCYGPNFILENFCNSKIIEKKLLSSKILNILLTVL